MADCNTPAQRPCGPGPFVSQTCYTVPPDETILPGFRRVTLNPDCSLNTAEILDSAQVVVPGAVEVGCPSACADCASGGGAALEVQSAGLPVASGVTCLNFTGAASASVVGSCIEVNVTPGAVAFPLTAPNGTCAAPSYSFVASPDSGMFYNGTAVVIGDDNCTDFIEVGASINVVTTTGGAISLNTVVGAGPIALNSGGTVAVVSTGIMLISSSAGLTITGSTGAILEAVAVGADVVIRAVGDVEIRTSGGFTQRLTVTTVGEWDIGGSVGAVGEVITSNGAGLPPTWQAAGALTFPILAPDGTALAPSYSFATQPACGLFYAPGTPGLVVQGGAGQQIVLDESGGEIQLFSGAATGAIEVDDSLTHIQNTALGGSVRLSTLAGLFELTDTGEVDVNGSVGTSGQVITSAGPGLPAAWTTQTVGSGGMVWAAANIGSAAETRIIPVGYDDALISTQTPKGYSSPRAGTFRNMYVRTNTANGNGASVTYTLRVNGVATLLSVTRATGAVGTSTNLVNTVAVAAGDLIEMMAIKPAGIGSGVQEVFVTAEFGA